MRYSRLRGSAAIVTAAVLLVAAAGCGSDDDTAAAAADCPTAAQPGLALALGARANSPAPKLPELIASYLTDIPVGKGFTVVRVDGQPSIACAGLFSSTSKASAALADERLQFGQYAVDQMHAARAAEAEANPLGALAVAASAAGSGGTVVLVDSGLQTVEPLNFRKPGNLVLTSGEIVRQLKAADQLPDLTGKRVVLSGIGYTASPQKPLDVGLQRHLVEIWTAIAKAGGATDVQILEDPSTDAAVGNVPKVSDVPVPEIDGVTAACGTEIALPDEGAVGFLPDQAVYRDSARAKGTLLKVVEFLKQNPAARVVATGSVAHYGENRPDSGLALERAQTVVATLAGFGVSPGRLEAHGIGWGLNQGTGDDVDQSNRRVVLKIDC